MAGTRPGIDALSPAARYFIDTAGQPNRTSADTCSKRHTSDVATGVLWQGREVPGGLFLLYRNIAQFHV
jgi:hypothetical protein